LIDDAGQTLKGHIAPDKTQARLDNGVGFDQSHGGASAIPNGRFSA
jgi:hypothetical protein